MKVACVLKRLRRMFPDARWIKIDTERGVNRDGQLEIEHHLYLRLADGSGVEHTSENLTSILFIAEGILSQQSDVLMSNEVFKQFAMSTPASEINVKGGEL